jgi:uncharacterized protein (UPF0333 family)
MKNTSQLVPACIAALALCAPAVGVATAKTAPSSAPSTATSVAASAKAAPPAVRNTTERLVPFHGVISAADENAKTFTITGKEKSRVFKITDKTVLTKAGLAATMKDIAVNEEVRGSYWKAADGTLEARMVKLGPRTEAEKGASKKHSRKKASKSEVTTSAGTSPSGKP